MVLVKATIESQVISYYLNSGGYNGLPLSKLAESLEVDTEDVLELVIQMVKTGRLFIPSPYQTNPFIKAFDAPIQEQLLGIDERNPSSICLYPTEASISSSIDTSQYDDKPFTKQMVLAYPKFTPIAFRLDVLDTYQRDPRYDFYLYDFGGRIQTADNPPDQFQERDKVEIRFGVGYGDEGERMVVVYLHHLASLPGKHQRILKEFLTDQTCHVAEEFIKTTILAKFPDAISVYHAIIQEQVEINKLFRLLSRPQLFRKTFEDHRRPREFSFFMKPTLRNYGDFVHLFDKMLSENININALGNDVCREERVEMSSGEIEVRSEGSIALLEEWLLLRYSTLKGVKMSQLIKPIQEVRRLRQKPAHKITLDRYDNRYYVLQEELVGKVYVALHGIRSLLAKDPALSAYKPPTWFGKLMVKSY